MREELSENSSGLLKDLLTLERRGFAGKSKRPDLRRTRTFSGLNPVFTMTASGSRAASRHALRP
jgi:hypothetical protein